MVPVGSCCTNTTIFNEPVFSQNVVLHGRRSTRRTNQNLMHHLLCEILGFRVMLLTSLFRNVSLRQ
jgi:hypothetical protein